MITASCATITTALLSITASASETTFSSWPGLGVCIQREARGGSKREEVHNYRAIIAIATAEAVHLPHMLGNVDSWDSRLVSSRVDPVVP